MLWGLRSGKRFVGQSLLHQQLDLTDRLCMVGQEHGISPDGNLEAVEEGTDRKDVCREDSGDQDVNKPRC